jgi:hypothetical protein
MPRAPRTCAAFAACAVALLAVLLGPVPAGAAPGPSPYGWFRYGLPPAERDRPPPGQTRDQTSPLGLQASLGQMVRRVAQPIGGGRFEFDVSSTRLLIEATLRPVRRVELFGLMGQADLDSVSDGADFDGDFGLAYGGGARATLVRERGRYDTAFFVEGRYVRFESEAADVLLPGPGAW